MDSYIYGLNSSSKSIFIVIFTFCVINLFLSDSGTPFLREKPDKTRELSDLVLLTKL